MSPRNIALWCAFPLAIGIIVDSLELVADRVQLREGGIYGYSVLATGRPVLLARPLAPILGLAFRYPNVLSLAYVQLLASAVLLTAATTRSPELIVPAGTAAAIVLAARMLLYLRNQLGLDGSDQMLLVVCSGLTVALLVPERASQAIALDYIAAQLLLSYAVAGIAKAASPTWRSGRALPGILSTIGYGIPRLGKLLDENPQLARILCWSVILFECTAPLLILVGTPGAIVVVAAGILFHLSISYIMGLNIFPWSFGAAYPALLWLAHSIGTLWQ